MDVEPLSIIVLQIVLSFSSRSILATQTNLSLVLKKWYLHARVGFPSYCHKTQPTIDFQEEMVLEPPWISVLQSVLSFSSRSVLVTQTNLSLVLKKWYLHAGVDSLHTAIKLSPPMTLRRNGYGTIFNYCPPNCTMFLFKIHRRYSNQS